MAIVVILAIGTFAFFCVGIVYNAACAAMKGEVMRTYTLTEEQFETCLAALAAAEVDADHARRYAPSVEEAREHKRSADNYGRVHGELLPMLNGGAS